MSDGGKGHTQRPRSVADEEWANRWDAIFGKDKPKLTEENKDDKDPSQTCDTDQGLG